MLPPLTQSLINRGLRSPRHLQHAMLYPPDRETPATRLGTAIHTAVLQPETFDERYCLRPLGMDLRTKEGRAWAKANAGITALTAEEHAAVMGCQATLNHLGLTEARKNASHVEERLFWSVDGVSCSGQPDLIVPLDDETAQIIDIKTTRDAGAIAGSVYQYGYHRQEWWYRKGVESEFGYRVDSMLFYLIEPEPPYQGVVIELARDWMVPAEADCLRAVSWVRSFGGLAEWPGYDHYIRRIEMPSWVRSADSKSLTEGTGDGDD